MNEQFDAVVAGLSETGLAVARSLSLAGLKVVGLHFGSEETPSSYSRHIHFIRGPDLENEQELLQFYSDIAEKQNSKPVLLPTGDQNLLFVYRNRDILHKLYDFYIWESDYLEVLASKMDFLSLANELQLPIPDTIAHTEPERFLTQAKEIDFPCVIKPEQTHFWTTPLARKHGLFGVKALPVESFEYLQEIYPKLIEVSTKFILQKKILGPDTNHVEFPALVEPDGEIKTRFVARKLRVAPAHYGMGCLVESIVDEAVVIEAREILSKLNYRGLGMVQFKRDDRDNKLYLLEINPRFTVWTGLPVACGVNFPLYYYHICKDETYEPPESYIVGKVWWNPLRDIFETKTYLKDGSWTIWSWLLSVARPHVNAYFTLDDPQPGLVAVVHVCSRLFGAIKRRLG